MEVSMAGVVGNITLLATRETTGDRNMDRLAPRGSSRSAVPIVVLPIAHKRIVVASTVALLATVTLSVVRPTGVKKSGATIGTIADRLASIATTRPKSDSLAAASLLTSNRTRRASSL
jgi:hypothetical protein